MWNRPTLALALLATAAFAACDDEDTQSPQEPVDRMAYWEQQATQTAKKNAAFEFSCEQLTTETLDRNDAVMVKWYSIGVTGCGKKAVYEVTCANQQCDADRKGELLDDPASAGTGEPEPEEVPSGDEAEAPAAEAAEE